MDEASPIFIPRTCHALAARPRCGDVEKKTIEQYDGEQAMDPKMVNLIDILHKAHCDNSEQQYYAKWIKRGEKPIMPVTSFVYEFFLFNSLYQVDWAKSYSKHELIFHPDNFSETKQQYEFLKFIREHAQKNRSDLYRAFEPLIYQPKAVGEWTKVTPDARITEMDGNRFFKKIAELQEIIEQCASPSELPPTEKISELIKIATHFIYLVRNNIFHGSKTLGETYEKNQKRRIEVYDLFLKALTSLFFLSVGKTSVASDFVPCPISSQSVPVSCDSHIHVLGQTAVWSALDKKIMKLEDSRLVYQFTKSINPPKETPSDRSSLFYPSSGTDFLTPLLLGLPYCTQFYFFERSSNCHSSRLKALIDILREIPTVKLDDGGRWKQQDNYLYIEFEFDGILRKIFWVHSDNKEFLNKDIDLSFYFHRGDSLGEGGSGQKWDSVLLPDLQKMIPVGKYCVCLTDGEPGEIDKSKFESIFKLDIPFLKREGRKYYCGKLLAHTSNIA